MQQVGCGQVSHRTVKHSLLLCFLAIGLLGCARHEAIPRQHSAEAAAPVTASEAPAYPEALLGTWRLVPGDCEGVDNSDADGVLRIEARTAHGYESGYKPRAVETQAEGRRWRVKVEELYGGMPGSLEWQTFTLEQERLVIDSDGHSEQYRRCLRR